MYLAKTKNGSYKKARQVKRMISGCIHMYTDHTHTHIFREREKNLIL